MSLSLYRRHREDCRAGRAPISRTGEFEERKKGWKRCDCAHWHTIAVAAGIFAVLHELTWCVVWCSLSAWWIERCKGEFNREA
jgi:hypothetical protein